MRQLDGALDRLFQDSHAVVLLQHRGESAHHPHGNLLGGLFDLDHLEPPGERRVFLEILLVLSPGCGSDGAQLTARQGRLEQVGGVSLAGRSSRANERMGLIDEKDDGRRRRLYLLDRLLEPVLELALDTGSSLEQAEVEGAQNDVAKRGRNIALGNPQRQPLDDRGLAHARLARENRVVLPAADQDIHDLPNLGLAADHRVNLSLPGALREIDAELIEGRRLADRVRTRARRGTRRAGIGCAGTRPFIFARAGNQSHQVRLEHIGLDLA